MKNAHPQTISTPGHAEKVLRDDPRTWSRGDWAAARYNWYRACGLLGDSPQHTAEIATYQKSPDPPPPKPYLKWYPLSKPDDDVATTSQRPVAASPSAPPRRYCQRVENAHATLARYQADQEEQAQGTGQRPPFVEADHNRVPKGSSRGGEFAPKTSLFQSNEGKHFLVSTDDKWRHKPSPGLHVPTLPHDRVEKFLDLVEQGSALQGALSENYWKRSAVRNEIQSRGWSPFPSPHHLKSLKARQAELERDQAGLKYEWSKLESEYKKAGFHTHFVTGYRAGANAEYQQSSEEGRGLYKAARAYDKTQEEDVRGGPGLEPTYDEMAIVSAPADLLAAYRLGSAVLRTGYHVVKQCGGYTLRKHLAKQAAKAACAKSDDLVDWYWKKWRIPSDASDLRSAYVEEVERLAEYSGNLLGRGTSEHEVALAMQELRRGLGVKYKDATPPDLREYIYKFNEARYQDKLGPTYEYMSKAKGYSDARIIAGASRVLGNKKKLGRELLEHFGDEIRPILKKYDMID